METTDLTARGGSGAGLTVALVTEVFHQEDGPERLAERLRRARERGAELAVLPELPFHPWSPAGREPRDEDAEPPEGRRHRLQEAAAREAGLALLGGAIVRDPVTGRRHNTALLFGPRGRLLASYAKLHVPEEEGFWETSHYQAGHEPPRVVEGLGLPLGIQICSDVNRPELCHVLAARGAGAILAPRATPEETWPRWRLVLQANAVTSGTWIVTVNRPGPEAGVGIGGPSAVMAPDGSVRLETTEPLALAHLDRGSLERGRRDYPGYLAVRADLYARAWTEVLEETAARNPERYKP